MKKKNFATNDELTYTKKENVIFELPMVTRYALTHIFGTTIFRFVWVARKRYAVLPILPH